jgi:hypothetical protein
MFIKSGMNVRGYRFFLNFRTELLIERYGEPVNNLLVTSLIHLLRPAKSQR